MDPEDAARLTDQPKDFCPFVVFGASKSGTTWLQRTLDSHPDICCHFQRPIFPIVGELRRRLLFSSPVVFNRNESPYGGVFEDSADEKKYVFGRAYLFEMDLLKDNYLDSTCRGLDHDTAEHVEQLHVQCVQGLIANALSHDTSKRIVGTKVFTDLDQLFRFYPTAKVIHIIRDGRDVAVSKRFHYLRQGAYYQGDERRLWLRLLNRSRPGAYLSRMISNRLGIISERSYATPGEDAPLLSGPALTKLATEWRNIVNYIDEFSRKRPGQVLTIKYEDMKIDPGKTISEAFRFLEADDNFDIVSKVAESTSFSKQKGGGFFRKGTAGDWVNHFTRENRTQFNEIAGDLLVRLGYEDSADWVNTDRNAGCVS